MAETPLLTKQAEQLDRDRCKRISLAEDIHERSDLSYSERMLKFYESVRWANELYERELAELMRNNANL